jgi:tagaturonate epimerase
MLTLPKYSMGIGDRFAHQGKAQLEAMMLAAAEGVEVAPVWNKSNREHQIIHSQPGDVRREADTATSDLKWERPYFVDADHIGLGNVDGFLTACDFYTLDVAEEIGTEAGQEQIDAFVKMMERFTGCLEIEGIDEPFEVSAEDVRRIAATYLAGVQEAGRIYRRIVEVRGEGTFVTEVSMDETEAPQTPVEMFFILAAVAAEGIPAQTIAPKFTGRFNKGVDYVGDVAQFTREFRQDLAVVARAVKEFNLPANLKLSVHSGSDKFALYGPIHEAITEFGAGLHLKTAGTTWLEEIIGLAEGGGEGLAIAKDVYAAALGRYDELCGPYATVIDIDRDQLPPADEVAGWDGAAFAAALRHDQSCTQYNPSLRQLLHVAYKVAAEMGARFTDALEAHEQTIARNVTENIFARHLTPIFIG